MSSDSPSLVPATASGSPNRRLALDNLIRRELRVGDPSDPTQVAQALLQRYADTPVARSLVNEARGMPFLQTVTLAAPVAPAQTATSLDLKQAKDDIDADLHELLTSNQLKDITPELEGWAQAIRSAVAEGERAAAYGMETRQRDKTFAIRRQLGDYARAARLVGTFNARGRENLRSLAQSLDEAASVLLVMLGESLANTGIAGGRYLLQVPYSELQARREAVLYALRNLNGSAQYGPNDWPRGVDAYRQLFDVLERHGQGELRSLLTEAEMARILDEMIGRASHGVAGLRALGATAVLDLQRFQRLVATIAWRASDPESPALTALHEALQLFMDGFDGTGGTRLIGIARPPILLYGLYGSGSVQAPAERRLQSLVRHRGQLAATLDCFIDCCMNGQAARWQALLDKVLYDVDRAIDLYSVGSDELGLPEIRAAAYGLLIGALSQLKLPPAVANTTDIDAGLRELLKQIGRTLVPETTNLDWESNTAINFETARVNYAAAPGTGREPLVDVLQQELCLGAKQDEQLAAICRQMSDGCNGFERLFVHSPKYVELLQALARKSSTPITIAALQQQLEANPPQLPPSGDFELLQACAGILATQQVDPGLIKPLWDTAPSIPSTIETSNDGSTYGRERNGQSAVTLSAEQWKQLVLAIAGNQGGTP